MTPSRRHGWLLLLAATVATTGGSLPPKHLLCPYSTAAWKFARRIQPWCGHEVFAGLGLGAGGTCNYTAAYTPPSQDTRTPLPAAGFGADDGGAAVVDPTKGDDTGGDGSAARPFATLGRGIRAVCSAEHRAAGKVKRVVLFTGQYNLGVPGGPLVLGPEASGIEIVAAPGEEPVITGGVEISPVWRRWRPAGPSRGSKTGSPPIFVADIPAQQLPPSALISELLVGSRRMVTAREPDADVYEYRTWQGGLRAASNWGAMQWAAPGQIANHTAAIVEKRGPAWDRNISCGDVHFRGAFGGSLNAFADRRGCGWAGHTPLNRQRGLGFSCPNASQQWCSKPWQNASEATVWCSGLWANLEYTVFAHTSAAAATEASTATVINLTFGSGGNQMAFGPLWPGVCGYGFFVEGIIEALSAPGEFYHDRVGNRLFLVPQNANNASQPPPTSVLAVTATTVLRFAGSQAQPVRNVRLAGLTFRGAAKTFIGPHVSTTNGADWAVPRSAALEFTGVINVTVDRCRFDTLGGSAVLWSGFVRDTTVRNSTFRWLGGNGILAIGDDDWGNATGGDYPVNNTIDSCLFREIGVYAKHSAAYAEFVAGAVKIVNTIIFNVRGPGLRSMTRWAEEICSNAT